MRKSLAKATLVSADVLVAALSAVAGQRRKNARACFSVVGVLIAFLGLGEVNSYAQFERPIYSSAELAPCRRRSVGKSGFAVLSHAKACSRGWRRIDEWHPGNYSPG